MLEVRWFAFVIRESEFDFRVLLCARIDFAGAFTQIKALIGGGDELAAEEDEGYQA
jgi:hypothetical protein